MSISLLANGSITPARFVKLDTTQVGGFALQCGANDKIFGVAQQGTRQAPLSGLDDGFAGIAGVNEITVYTVNDVCWVEVGGAVTAGDYLEADTNGRAVTSSTDGHNYGAIAMESATALGQYVKARVLIGMRGA